MFDLVTAHDFYAMLVQDFDDYMAEPHSARRAVHCAIAAHHLCDWVWHDKVDCSPALRTQLSGRAWKQLIDDLRNDLNGVQPLVMKIRTAMCVRIANLLNRIEQHPNVVNTFVLFGHAYQRLIPDHACDVFFLHLVKPLLLDAVLSSLPYDFVSCSKALICDSTGAHRIAEEVFQHGFLPSTRDEVRANVVPKSRA